MLPSDTLQDEHTRRVGPQELGRANLWGRPTARSASNQTYASSGHPHGRESFGVAARSHADLERDQSLVSFAALMQPHVHQTRDQANASPVVLLVQDTTAIDLSHRHKISGVGHIGNERGRGFFVQTVLAVRPQSPEVLGCMAQDPFMRVPAPQGEQRQQRLKREGRESDVWIRQVQTIGTPAPGSVWVHVGDRGADMFPFCRSLSDNTDPLSGTGGKVTACAGERGRDHVCSGSRTRLSEPGEPSV